MDVEELRGKTLEGMIDKLRELPVLPAVIVKLMSQSPESDAYFDEVLSLAESDPPFAARIIQGANAASSSPAEPVTTLRGALTRLGAKAIGQLVTSMAVARVFVPQSEGQQQLWIHTLKVAVLSREIAALGESIEVDSDKAYLAGLLHDLGRFVMFDESPNELAAVDDLDWTTPQELVEAEQKICGFDHAELGWHACQIWGIPDSIAEAVRHHHDFSPEGCTEDSSQSNQLVATVQMADAIAIKSHEQEDLNDLDESSLAGFVSSMPVYQGWTLPPVRAECLSPRLLQLIEESESLAVGLGLRPS